MVNEEKARPVVVSELVVVVSVPPKEVGVVWMTPDELANSVKHGVKLIAARISFWLIDLSI